MTSRARKLLDRIKTTINESGASVPNAEALAESLHLPSHAVEQMLNQGVSTRELVLIGSGLYFTVEGLDAITSAMKEQFSGQRFEAAEAKRAMGAGRKPTIALLEYWSDQGITERDEDDRHRFI